jgi:hypothetical protein
MLRVTRDQVIAYRVAAQGLHRQVTKLADVPVLDIGVQEAAGEQARLAFDARLATPPDAESFGPGRPLALVWSLRGAPHVHRRAELNALAGALYPSSEADAAGRLNETGPSVARAGISALEQVALATRAMHEVVSAPTAKGAASTAVTQRLPEPMRRWCRVCQAHHLSDSAMRLGSLLAGLELQPGTSPPVLQPRPRAKRPVKPDITALRRLVVAYLTLLGPANVGDAAGYVEARRADLERAWPDNLVEVSVDGNRAYLPAGQQALLESPPEPSVVRLLGGFDPYLQARDRDLLVPDRSLHKALWPVLGRPGVLLVDGEVIGTWRPKASGARLTVVVGPFAPLPAHVREAIEDEAGRVGAVRGVERVTVSFPR